MITIVCSSINPDEKYKEHVLKACGLKNVQFLFYENKNQYSLAEIYNKGLDESIYDYIVFIHDDLIFNCENFGNKIFKHFKKNPEYGILGLAGTTNIPENGVWWTNRELMVGKVTHTHENKTWVSRYCYNNDYDVLDVALVDGLFLMVNKNIIKHKFDTRFEGFHFYDVSFCVSNKISGCKIGVVFDIDITHKSIGATNEKWENNRLLFLDLYKSVLPIDVECTLYYDNKPVLLKKQPKVSIIIPTKGKLELLFKCINSFFNKTSYNNYEIIIADTGSSEYELKELENFILLNKKIRLIKYDYYNFAEINNKVVLEHTNVNTELLLFCNNDIELINDALSMVIDTYNKNTKCGTVGCRLHFADNKIQHDGIIMYVDRDNRLQVTHQGLKSCYNYRNFVRENKWGSTGAFLLINRNLFLKLNGFVRTSECFEDVILNIQTTLNGYKNFVNGRAVCYHLESQTRNDSNEKITRTINDFHNYVIPLIVQNQNKLFVK